MIYDSSFSSGNSEGRKKFCCRFLSTSLFLIEEGGLIKPNYKSGVLPNRREGPRPFIALLEGADEI